MIEALIAFVVAVLVVAVFQAPAWVLKLGVFGGVAFSLYVLILVIEYLIAKFK